MNTLIIQAVMTFGICSALLHKAGWLRSSVRGVALVMNLLLLAWLIWQMLRRIL